MDLIQRIKNILYINFRFGLLNSINIYRSLKIQLCGRGFFNLKVVVFIESTILNLRFVFVNQKFLKPVLKASIK